MEEMVKIEIENKILTEEIVKELKKFQKTKLKMDLMQEELKEKLRLAMENNGIDKWVSSDGTIVVNYFPEKITKKLDTTKLKEEQKEIYNKYLKDTTAKSFVKIAVK